MVSRFVGESEHAALRYRRQHGNAHCAKYEASSVVRMAHLEVRLEPRGARRKESVDGRSEPTLLIVDDHADSRMLLAELMGGDCRILLAQNGTTATNWLL